MPRFTARSYGRRLSHSYSKPSTAFKKRVYSVPRAPGRRGKSVIAAARRVVKAAELKNADYNISAVTFAQAAPILWLVECIQQGDDINQRIGRQVVGEYANIR